MHAYYDSFIYLLDNAIFKLLSYQTHKNMFKMTLTISSDRDEMIEKLRLNAIKSIQDKMAEYPAWMKPMLKKEIYSYQKHN